MSEKQQNDYGLSPELYENIKKYHRALTTKNANQEVFSTLAVDRTNIKRAAQNINIEDVRSGKVKPGARVIKFVKLLDLANKGEGKWEFAGMEDTGHKGNALCDLGHPLRYIWYAQNEGVVLALGVKCFSDFFMVTNEVEEELDKALNMIKGDMSVLDAMKKGEVVSKNGILADFFTPLVLTMFKNGNRNFFISSYAKFISLGLEPLKSMVIGSAKEILTTPNLIKYISGYNIKGDETPFIQLYSYVIYRGVAETLSEYGIRMTKIELPYDMGKFTVADTLKNTNVIARRFSLRIDDLRPFQNILDAMNNSNDKFKLVYRLLQEYINCEGTLKKTNDLNDLLVSAKICKAANSRAMIEWSQAYGNRNNNAFYDAYRFFTLSDEELKEAEDVVCWVNKNYRIKHSLFMKICKYKTDILRYPNVSKIYFMTYVLREATVNEVIQMCNEEDTVEKECLAKLQAIKNISSMREKIKMYESAVDIYTFEEADKIISKAFINVIGEYKDKLNEKYVSLIEKFKLNKGVSKLTRLEFNELLHLYVMQDLVKNGLQGYITEYFKKCFSNTVNNNRLFRFNLTKASNIKELEGSILRYANIEELAKVWNILNSTDFGDIVVINAALFYRHINKCTITAKGVYDFSEIDKDSFIETLGLMKYENVEVTSEFIDSIRQADDEETRETNTKLDTILAYINEHGEETLRGREGYSVITDIHGHYFYSKYCSSYYVSSDVVSAIDYLYSAVKGRKVDKVTEKKVSVEVDRNEVVDNKTYYFKDYKTDEFIAKEVKKVYAILKCVQGDSSKRIVIDSNKQLSFAWTIMGTVAKMQKFSTKQLKFVDMLYDALLGDTKKEDTNRKIKESNELGKDVEVEENRTYFLRDNSEVVQDIKAKMDFIMHLSEDELLEAEINQFDSKVLDIISSVAKYKKCSSKQLRHIVDTYNQFKNRGGVAGI